MFLVFILSNLVLLVLGAATLRYVALLSKLPASRLLAAAILFSFAGAYATNYSLFDVLVMVVFGLVGYLFIALDIPREPLLITFLLAPQIEANLGQSLALGGWGIFVSRPISLALTCVLALTVTFLLARLSSIHRLQRSEDELVTAARESA